MQLPFGTVPYAHQLAEFEKQRNRFAYAEYLDMGTGKTKIGTDTAFWLYQENKIDIVLILAPNGVHRNWTDRELPIHAWKDVKHSGISWVSGKAKVRKAWDKLIEQKGAGLKFFAMATESLTSPLAKKAIERLLHSANRRVLWILDESQYFKGYSTQRTKFIHEHYGKALYRRILSGTPAPNGPLDLWSQYMFLHPKIIGFSNYFAYRTRYAELKRVPRKEALERARNARKELRRYTDRTTPEARKLAKDSELNKNRDYFDQIVKYRRIDELKKKIAPYTSVIRKEDCLDLPPKVYEVRQYEMSADQRKMYKDMLETGVANLIEGGESVAGMSPLEQLWNLIVDEQTPKTVAKNALSVALRLQQISGGYLISDDGEFTWRAKKNPKLSGLLDIVENEISGKLAIWTRFREEVAIIKEALPGDVVEYHGGIDNDTRFKNVDAFQDPEGARFIILTVAAGHTGITLTAASNAFYYSNSYNGAHRWQSEDRHHRIGQTKTVTYTDMLLDGTLDEKVLQTLRDKRSIQDDIMDI